MPGRGLRLVPRGDRALRHRGTPAAGEALEYVGEESALFIAKTQHICTDLLPSSRCCAFLNEDEARWMSKSERGLASFAGSSLVPFPTSQEGNKAAPVLPQLQ